MESTVDIRADLDATAAAVEDIATSANDADMDGTIDNIIDAAGSLELDDEEDNEDIDSIEGLEEEEIEVYADNEDEAAEIELIADVSREHSNDAEEIAEEVEASTELNEAYHLIDDELINFVVEEGGTL